MRGHAKQVTTAVVVGAVALVVSGCIEWAEPVGQAVPIPAGQTMGQPVPADVDGDGDDDLLSVSWTGTTLATTVLVSDGDGTFSPGHGLEGHPEAVADVDDDGDDDVILRWYAPNWASQGYGQRLYRGGPGGPSLADSVELPRAVGYQFGDLDGDGDQDLLRTLSWMTYYFEYASWLNDGTGVFTQAPAGPASPFSLYQPRLHRRADRSVVLAVDGPSGWTNAPGLPSYVPGDSFAFGDIDGDGDDDVAHEHDDDITFYEWTGTAFAAYPPYEDIDAIGPAVLQLVALDTDAGADLAITDNDGTRIIGGSADGGFPYADTGATVVRQPTFADVDGDGLLDAVTKNAAGTGIEVFLNISDT